MLTVAQNFPKCPKVLSTRMLHWSKSGGKRYSSVSISGLTDSGRPC